MNLDARKCAELLAIRERAPEGPYAPVLGRSFYDDEADAWLIDSPNGSICEMTCAFDDAREGAEFLSSAHDLADQLRAALDLLKQLRAVADLHALQHGSGCALTDDLIRKLTEAGI